MRTRNTENPKIIVAMVKNGSTDREIAYELGLTTMTVAKVRQAAKLPPNKHKAVNPASVVMFYKKHSEKETLDKFKISIDTLRLCCAEMDYKKGERIKFIGSSINQIWKPTNTAYRATLYG